MRRFARGLRPMTSPSMRRRRHRNTMMSHPFMQEWIAAAKVEPDQLEELDVEF